MGINTFGYEEIVVSNTAVGLTPSKIDPFNTGRAVAFITVKGAAVCFRYDGGTPTNATANYLEPGDTLLLNNIAKLKNFLAISRDGGSALLGVNYEWEV